MKSAFPGLQNQSSKNPILVIDRLGLIGEPFALKLAKEFLVVFVSQKSLDQEENKNIFHVPLVKKFPSIPDSKYSQIILIDEGGGDLEFLPKIIEKVKAVNADFIFAQGLFPGGKYVVDKILRLYPSTKIVLFGDIFGKELIFRKNFPSVINKYIYQAQKFGKMQVLGEGLREVYPVFLNDVVEGLVSLISGAHKSQSLFYLFPKYPPTELSLAHMIQKINPEITIDFTKNDLRLKEIFYSTNGLNLLEDNYPLAQKIRRIDILKKVDLGDENSPRIVKKIRNFPLFIYWILIILFFLPFIFTNFFAFLGLTTLDNARGEIDKGNLTNAQRSLQVSQSFYALGKQSADMLFLQAKMVGLGSGAKKLVQNLDSGEKTTESLGQIFSAGNYFDKVLLGKSENPGDDFAKGKNYLKNALIILDKVKAEGKIPAPVSQNLEKLAPLIKLLSSTSEILPSIFGMNGEKTYLLLFQNNLELRPTGGLIDSYGILKFNQGKLTEFSVHAVSDADNQLRGHVEPPFAIRRYLPSAHWYLRDSNFDVDFTQSAVVAANFILVEAGQKVSGVIAVPSTFPKDLQNNKASFLAIAQTISTALAQKKLLFAFPDSQNIFTVNGWSAALWDERKKTLGMINDFVGMSEANLGMNEINGLVQRQVSQKVAIADDGNILEELAIDFKNNSATLSGADYKNYLRIILPQNASLSEISINEKSQNIVSAVTSPAIYEAKNFKAPSGLEVEKTQEEGKEIFGFLIRVPAGESVKVQLKYSLGKTVLEQNNFSYNLKLFKQSGVENIPYTFSLTYPAVFSVLKSSDKLNEGEGAISYSEKILGDKNLIINFAKK